MSDPEQKRLLTDVNRAIEHRDETYVKNDDVVWEKAKLARAAGIPDTIICRATGLSRTTLQRRLGNRDDGLADG